MNIPAASLTIGGLFVGIAIPLWHTSRFAMANIKNRAGAMKGAVDDLVPLAAGMAYGGIATATTSGLLGFATGAITWLGNGAGTLAMWGATGGDADLAVRSPGYELSGMGNLVLLLLTVVVLGGWKKIPADWKPRMRVGIVSGVLLGLSATLGGAVMATVIPAANNLGSALVGTIA
ncbi:hypothetical protein [Kitasatospora cheerisanensis]|uniref:Uncharacterized protein n=1 Tax=Kitasatospora cheerisanensis KCTC 2395 TaxID=1348663 RepID=A0A066YH66_9ACTN|nr:hypothetical protein [Kitasatospora cheerisanensis]KDN80492.1 hypothetical protein KCH_77260 [Kitasatospora cheerisanensis KCTC 2395]